MRVTVYDATNARDADGGHLISHRLETLPRISVDMRPASSVAYVLTAGGHSPYNTFALVTPEMEADFAREGDDHMITGVYNLFGIDDSGAIKFQDADHLTWAEFIRATEAGLHRGDPTRIVVYHYRGFGGPLADGLLEIVRFLFENREVGKEGLGWINEAGGAAGLIVGGVLGIKEMRRKRIAEKWREQGFTAQRIRNILGRLPQWDPSVFAKQWSLSEPEARLALTNAGYQPGPQDGLWRLADTEDGRQRRKGLEEIEKRARADLEAEL
jgi:hypothetical protein